MYCIACMSKLNGYLNLPKNIKYQCHENINEY